MKLTRIFLAIALIAFFFIPAGCDNSDKTKEPSTVENTDKFADNIRTTAFQSPEDEQKGFHLPPGFEITLFASEPDISKPINMEFDNKGRLWVTSTTEYPMPAAPGRGRDKIIILEDVDGDGKADKFTPFVDSLNIPIGITTVNKGAIAYSIPNVYKFIDKNGDDKADETIKLLGPFEFADTHGMVNNLVRGYDGWIYACHGYANNSTVAGADGDSIHMNSGNTFRFREDGSRVESTTYGRVNPFGYAYDDWGYLYSLDCHTKPIYQLIDGASYPGQGVREPAIGWAPVMMSYEFGSTANSGLVFYSGTQFPAPYQQNFYSGNVVTSRINRNTVNLYGSTPECKREEDFLISDDPWFRPVDLKTGPDGAIYVADFYNRIIGHYEVPKDHPGRDKTSGRIWKITYKGKDAGRPQQNKDWSKATIDELVKALNYPQVNTRMMIANCLVDIYAQKAVQPVQQMMSGAAPESKSFIQGLWILFRLNALPENLLQKALYNSDPMVQVHGLRVLAQQPSINEFQKKFAVDALKNNNAQVQRMAAVVLGHFHDYSYLQALIAVHSSAGEKDSHLKYTAILSIKDHLNNPTILQKAMKQSWTEEQSTVLMSVIPEVPSKQAAMYALAYLEAHPASGKKMVDNLQFIARYIDIAGINNLITQAKKNAVADVDAEYNFYEAIRQGVAQKGDAPGSALKSWGISIATRFLANSKDSAYRQERAAKIVLDYKVASLEPSLKQLLLRKSASPKTRAAAADVLMSLSAPRNLETIIGIFNDTREPDELRERLSGTIGQVQTPATLAIFERSLKGAPTVLQERVGRILAGSVDGINHLLRALKAGHVKPDLLEEYWVKETLIANISDEQRKTLGALTKGKMGVDNRKDLVMARLASFNPSAVHIDTGRQVFIRNCNICHSIENAPGGNIGPKLSGIGTWGPVALTQKILDPNLNISEAYRMYSIEMKDGKKLSGLFRREEGAVSVFADLTGQEFSVPQADIKERIPAKYTLMPDNFRNTITKRDFDALLKYLLSIKEN